MVRRYDSKSKKVGALDETWVWRRERREEGERKGWLGESPYGGRRKDDENKGTAKSKEPHKPKTSHSSLLQSISRLALDSHRSANHAAVNGLS